MRKVKKVCVGLVTTFLSALSIDANDFDRFNYGATNGRDFGLEDWNQVQCDEPGQCLGFPDSWETAIGWDLKATNAACEICTANDVANNNCNWCPEGSSDCGQHRQSPINLKRDRGLFNHPMEKKCPDWHWMKYRDGACKWEDLVDNDHSIHRNNFLIERHSLQILQPVDENGELKCWNNTLGGRVYPKLDYSKGFPDWWHLHHTEISVPSEHTQENVRYDAEVTLAHFYEVEHYKNQLGKVVIWLDGYDDVEPWPMLDKLICQWRETEEKNRRECGLDSVVTYYPGCQNYDRGHSPAPAAQSTPEPSTAPSVTTMPSSGPTTSPVTPSPTDEPTMAPITPGPTVNPSKVSIPSPAESNPTQGSGNVAPEAISSPITLSPVYIVDYVQPTPGPTNSLFSVSCNICGALNLRVHNSTGLVKMPGFYNYPCGLIETAGKVGFISPPICLEISDFVDECDCGLIEGVETPVTSPPETQSPVTPQPISPAPVSLSPTQAPSVVQDAPVTVSSGTPEPFIPEGPAQPTPHPTIPTIVIPPSFDITMPWFWSFVPEEIPPVIDCTAPDEISAGIDLNYNRMCKVGGCCDPDKRSATDFCHDAYSFFGESWNSVCYHCCAEPKIAAPAPAPHPVFPKIDCATVENPARMCKKDSNSCCQKERSDTLFCQNVYQEFGDTIHSICWYCCEEPTEVGADDPGSFRLLQLDSYKPINSDLAKMNATEKRTTLMKRLEIKKDTDENNELSTSDSLDDRKIDERKEKGFISSETYYEDSRDDEDYFKELMERHLLNENIIKDSDERLRRRLINYEDVSYWPYEWLLKVRTEYYFRYEGTQAVPPCKDQVHWRIMKDPIPVARRQIKELERLMAERIAPKDSQFKSCQPDNAGTVRPGTNGTKFDFARPIQEFHRLHRKVFCECKNWKSKFQEDIDWCKRNIIDRFYQHPYNFDFDTGIYMNSTV